MSEAMKQRRYLLLDDRLVARRVNAALRVTPAAKIGANPLFVEDKPWEVTYNNGYPNVILDPTDGLYKCWYHTWVTERAYATTPPEERLPGTWREVFRDLPGPEPRRQVGLCYATSRDGLTWRKGVLNLIDFNGSRRNNLVMRDAHGCGVFRDDHEVDPKKRYKMFFRDDQAGRHHMAVGFSADGLRWRRRACAEIAARGDTHNNAFWAPTLGKYVGVTRQCRRSKITGLVRQVARTISDDFVHWSRARIVLEGLDDDLQVYSMPVCCHAGVYLGMATILQISTDRVWVELAWSADTVHWHRVDPARPLIPCGARRGTYDWGCVYPSKPVFLDEDIRLYYFGSYGLHTDWRRGGLCLATLRPDGLAGYEPADPRRPAVIVTQPLAVNPTSLCVSADVKQGGHVAVAVRDARSKVLARSVAIRRTGTDRPIRWTGNGAAALPPGRALRLEFRLRNAKLYSLRL